MGGSRLRQLLVGEVHDAEESSHQREGGDIQAGTLALPLRDDPINVVRLALCQDSCW